MVKSLKIKRPLPRSAYEKNARTYKILSNSKRLEILNLLREQEMPVETLVKELGISKANVSQHLALLRHARLVTVHRVGLNAFYNIIDPRIVEPCRILHKLAIGAK
ncbi:MAG: helix-turn-helix transcriptional regulator [Candidatus Pacebacteria bacterium]|jgi:ArsR family transcriptional regulator|nr:helix-turn-helix transcriptional regulator [Candidatus Paceibacterota bacterium]